MSDEKQLTVAELLARSGKNAPTGDKSRPRRRRSLEEGGVSVAELTGSIPKVKAKPAEARHSNVPMDQELGEGADPAENSAAKTPAQPKAAETPKPADLPKGDAPKPATATPASEKQAPATPQKPSPAAAGPATPAKPAGGEKKTDVEKRAGKSGQTSAADKFAAAKAAATAKTAAPAQSATPEKSEKPRAGGFPSADAATAAPAPGSPAAKAATAEPKATEPKATEPKTAEPKTVAGKDQPLKTADLSSGKTSPSGEDTQVIGAVEADEPLRRGPVTASAAQSAAAGVPAALATGVGIAQTTDATGEIPLVGDAAPVETEVEDELEEDEGISPAAVIGLAVAGIILGILVFLGFDYLWGNFNRVFVGIAALVVTLAMVLGTRALRTTNDGLSMTLAGAAGLLMSFGPALIMYLT